MKYVQAQLQELPEGTLLAAKNGKYIKWFHYYNKELHYIKSRDTTKIEKLAYKKYLASWYKDLENELMSVQVYLKQHESYHEKSSQYLESNSKYRKFLDQNLKTFPQIIQEWIDTPYEKNINYPEKLKYPTDSGYYVRSKSEAMIDTLLYRNKIPFRYECALYIDEYAYYPDFTILHPQTGKIYYWEHFGRMDDSDYAQKCFSKIQNYANNGIIPFQNLIITCETLKHPFVQQIAEQTLRQYLL